MNVALVIQHLLIVLYQIYSYLQLQYWVINFTIVKNTLDLFVVIKRGFIDENGTQNYSYYYICSYSDDYS